MILKYKVEFLSEWLCASGIASEVDNSPILDQDGLPYVPGKTAKGLLRDVAEWILQVQPQDEWKNFINEVFGERSEQQEKGSKQGSCYFSNVILSHAVQQHLKTHPNEKGVLFMNVSSTSLDKNGQAKEHSLRKIQVVAPLHLFGQIDRMPEKYVANMKQCFKGVKRLGMNRNRGFGRCTIKEIPC